MMDMMQWLVDFSPAGDLMLRVTLVLSVGWVLHLLLFRGNPRWRVLLWRGVIVGVIATSALAPCGYWRVSVARPAEAAETSEPRAASTFEGTDVSAGAAREQASVAGGARPESSSGFSHVPAWVREHLAVIILVGWVLGAGVLAASFLGALLRTQRMLLRCQHALRGRAFVCRA